MTSIVAKNELDWIGLPVERVRERISLAPKKGKYVLYWMQASARVLDNGALQWAIFAANRLSLPLVVGFVLTDNYPRANRRHYQFLLESLVEVESELNRRGIRFVVRRGDPPEEILRLARDAAAMVFDVGYTTVQRAWRDQVDAGANLPIVEVEDNVVVPPELVFDHEAYMARSIRRKIFALLPDFLEPLRRIRPKIAGDDLKLKGIEIDPIEKLLNRMKIDQSVPPSPTFKGGQKEAAKRLRRFVRDRLEHYDLRRDPTAEFTSELSPYLHFGAISPMTVARAVWTSGSSRTDEFFEELVVQRELGINYAIYNPSYETFDALPNWARATLKAHEQDPRDDLYTFEQLRDAATSDPAWNAAQRQMLATGFMAGYMRMYWGKRVLQWCRKPRQAFDYLVQLKRYLRAGWTRPERLRGDRLVFWQARPALAQSADFWHGPLDDPPIAPA